MARIGGVSCPRELLESTKPQVAFPREPKGRRSLCHSDRPRPFLTEISTCHEFQLSRQGRNSVQDTKADGAQLRCVTAARHDNAPAATHQQRQQHQRHACRHVVDVGNATSTAAQHLRQHGVQATIATLASTRQHAIAMMRTGQASQIKQGLPSVSDEHRRFTWQPQNLPQRRNNGKIAQPIGLLSRSDSQLTQPQPSLPQQERHRVPHPLRSCRWSSSAPPTCQWSTQRPKASR